MKSFATKLSLCALALAVIPANCFARHKEVSPDPKFLAIGQITILPALDLRVDKKDNVSLDKLDKTVAGTLKQKNYATALTDNKGVTGDIAGEDLSEAKPEWVKKLGPADARWVLVVGLGDVHSKMSFGSSGNAEVVGYLFDKQDGSLMWKGTGIGQAGQGGLLGMAMKGAMSETAIEMAVVNLFNDIPKLPKNGK